MPEEESLEVTSENRHRGCEHGMLGQTVPSESIMEFNIYLSWNY